MELVKVNRTAEAIKISYNGTLALVVDRGAIKVMNTRFVDPLVNLIKATKSRIVDVEDYGDYKIIILSAAGVAKISPMLKGFVNGCYGVNQEVFLSTLSNF